MDFQLADSVISYVIQDGRAPLANAATSGSAETIQAILPYNPDLEARDDLGWTPLIIAASSGNLDVVKELIGAGADVTAANARDQTALHYAARYAKLDSCCLSGTYC